MQWAERSSQVATRMRSTASGIGKQTVSDVRVDAILGIPRLHRGDLGGDPGRPAFRPHMHGIPIVVATCRHVVPAFKSCKNRKGTGRGAGIGLSNESAPRAPVGG